MNLLHAGMTHVGRKRSHNEDTLHVATGRALYTVADGMGGYAAGEVASKLAVDVLADFYDKSSTDDDLTWPLRVNDDDDLQEARLRAGILLANISICEAAANNKKYQGMGSTIVSSYFLEDSMYVGHVGDSRAYRIRNQTIEQLTEDHSLFNEFKKKGDVTREDVANFPYKNILLRGLGKQRDVAVDVTRYDVESNDVFLLCSDGLTGELEDPEILQVVLEAQGDLDKACKELIRISCENGGRDNITALLVRCEAAN